MAPNPPCSETPYHWFVAFGGSISCLNSEVPVVLVLGWGGKGGESDFKVLRSTSQGHITDCKFELVVYVGVGAVS